MKHINVYITEAWGGVKQHTLKADIEAWCEDMGIRNYTVNSQGKIDVNSGVYLRNSNFKELPYKFGTVRGWFSLKECENLISLKNCPDKVGRFFSCSGCSQLDSLEGCPMEVRGRFFCGGCNRKFTIKEVMSLCKVKEDIMI